MASQLAETLLTAEQFLRIDFGPDVKAELDKGVIRMMAGGTRRHAKIQMNFYRFLGPALRGSGCRPYGSDFAIRTGSHSVRYPDVTVDCGTARDDDKVLSAPRIVIEVHSQSTRQHDQGLELDEHRALGTVDTIVLVDPEAERLRVLQRIGPGEWIDRSFAGPTDLERPRSVS